MLRLERCAITTRVAPSFLRVGHIDLFGRRARSSNATATEVSELEKVVSMVVQPKRDKLLYLVYLHT